MSVSASLLAGKNRRRALQALIAGPLLALGITAGSGTAHASSLTFIPAEVPQGGGDCTISGWPNGEILCGSSRGANFPNGTQEIFGIGLDGNVWTDWGTEARPSGWKSMGGFASQNIPFADIRINISNDGDYGLTISCVTIYGTTYYDKRGDGASAGWSGWFG
jgi:hypothetical protein